MSAIILIVAGLALLLFAVWYGPRIVEITRCRHDFRWMSCPGEPLDQRVCVKCGCPYHWDAGR